RTLALGHYPQRYLHACVDAALRRAARNAPEAPGLLRRRGPAVPEADGRHREQLPVLGRCSDSHLMPDRRLCAASICLALAVTATAAQQSPVTSSYSPTDQTQTFDQIKDARMAVKAVRAHDHADLLTSRYVLDVRTDPAVT